MPARGACSLGTGPRMGPPLWSWLWPLALALTLTLTLARGSSLSTPTSTPTTPTSTPITTPTEDWTNTTDTHTQTETQTDAQTHTHTQTHTQTHTGAQTETQTHVHTQPQTQADVHTQAHTQTHIQTQTHTQTHTQTNTHTQTDTHTQTQTHTQTDTQPRMETTTISSDYAGLSCLPLLPPRRGSFYVERGSGVSVGSVLAFWCRHGYQLVGSDKISCVVRATKPQWSNYLPVCEAIPRPEDRGLRVAVVASVVSGGVIVAMALAFLLCCLQERRGGRGGRGRRREKRASRRGECWLEREEGSWEAFPPPKVFHLSQRPPPAATPGSLAAPGPDSPLYLGSMAGYENRGYQRSQESLLKAPLPGQMYPHMVLQRFPTPTAPPTPPVYLHLPPRSSSSSSPSSSNAAPPPQPLLMAPYPAPVYPHPLLPRQHPWQ